MPEITNKDLLETIANEANRYVRSVHEGQETSRIPALQAITKNIAHLDTEKLSDKQLQKLREMRIRLMQAPRLSRVEEELLGNGFKPIFDETSKRLRE